MLDAPLTVDNFITLARRGFFNGLPIHRVVPNFVVQDGDPRGDGEGGPGYTIRDELNQRPYLRGTRRHGARLGGHRRQPVLHHASRRSRTSTVATRCSVAWSSGMDVVDRIEPWDVIRRVRVWDGSTNGGYVDGRGN